MTEKYQDFIGVYENSFSKDFCDYLINTFEKNVSNLGKERTDAFKEVDVNDISIFIGDVISSKATRHIHETLQNVIHLYNTKYTAIGSPINESGYQIADLKVQKTKPFQGYNIYHSEYTPHGEHSLRWGVYTVYLNDIKEGGETEFLYQGYRLSPKTGTTCIFPAYFTHTHRGNPPFKETKYILTGWLEYPPLNENNNN